MDKSGLLFCLANADLLDYDVSQQAVRALELITQGHSGTTWYFATLEVINSYPKSTPNPEPTFGILQIFARFLVC